MKEITKDTTLEKILKISGSREVLQEYEVPCLSCPFAKLEMGELTIGEICKSYEINSKELIQKLNELLK